MKLQLALCVAVLGLGLGACEADESAPKNPRRANFLTPDEKARDAAEKRELEPRKRELPTGGGREFPGQSQAEGPKVILAADFGPGADRSGTLPHLHTLPKDKPAAGATPVPGISYQVEHSWGQALPMAEYPHRAWPTSQATYFLPGADHNPTYYRNLSDQCGFLASGSTLSNVSSDIVEVPWFVVQTLILPGRMVLQCPWAKVTTHAPVGDPIFNGYLPGGGPTVPAPFPGVIEWKHDWVVNQATRPGAATRPGK